MITEAQLKADKAVTASRDSISVRLVVESCAASCNRG